MKRRKNQTRSEREALESFQTLQRKWDAIPKFSRTHGAIAKPSQAIPALTTPPGRSTGREHKSVDTGFNGGTKPIVGMKYTGTKMLGIGTLHKSNAVPVFSEQEATEMARMRRG